jgi:hypothetical protein
MRAIFTLLAGGACAAIDLCCELRPYLAPAWTCFVCALSSRPPGKVTCDAKPNGLDHVGICLQIL